MSFDPNVLAAPTVGFTRLVDALTTAGPDLRQAGDLLGAELTNTSTQPREASVAQAIALGRQGADVLAAALETAGSAQGRLSPALLGMSHGVVHSARKGVEALGAGVDDASVRTAWEQFTKAGRAADHALRAAVTLPAPGQATHGYDRSTLSAPF